MTRVKRESSQGRMFIFILVAMLLGLALVPAYANNIQVGTPTLTGQVAGSHTFVQFDLSWDNSWKTVTPNNWDAAWVFVKYKPTGGDWAHATLNNNGHSVTTDNGVASTITTPTGEKGVFLYRTNDATGSINWNGVKLRWNYGTGGDGLADSATVTVKVFAIEMVHIPGGDFYVGDGSSTYTFYDNDSATNPAQITDGSVNVNASSQMTGGPIAVDGDGGITGNTNYPTGYTAFYCMKYEISQGQYADFLNTLTATQDGTRYYSSTSYRYTIGGSAGSRSATRPDRACNYLSWMDGCAYADWAGLRPMTELEFEKVCRGPTGAVAGEYAWGDTIISEATNITGSENGTETVDGNCNYNYGSEFTGGDIGRGPLRCGIFATSSTTTRQPAGASYYGVMEMSGNLRERPVTLGNSDGRSFLGSHGDGSLSTNGHATNSDWPGGSGGEVSEVTGAAGAGFRGGNWGSGATSLRVSDRGYAAITITARNADYGFRCVRSSP